MELRGRKYLDRKLCWELYIKPGASLLTVVDELEKTGRASPRTGIAYKKSVADSAYLYVLEETDPAELKKRRDELAYHWRIQLHEELTEEQWIKWQIAKARSVYLRRPNKFRDFIQERGYHSYINEML